jgi:hypothetical protein
MLRVSMGARQDARIPARPGRKQDGSTSTHSPASSPSPQAPFGRHWRIPCTKLLAHLLPLLLHVLAADSVVPAALVFARWHVDSCRASSSPRSSGRSLPLVVLHWNTQKYILPEGNSAGFVGLVRNFLKRVSPQDLRYPLDDAARFWIYPCC